MRIALLILTACGSAAVPIQNAAPGGACPRAADVYIAESDAQQGWLLPLAGEHLESHEVEQGFAPLADASKLPAPPAKVWLYAGGTKPCEATAGAPYQRILDEGPVSATYGVRLVTSCRSAPGTLAVAVAGAPPTGCEMLLAKSIAARTGGQMDGSGGWSPPTDPGVAIPADLAPALPPHAACASPCEPLWGVDAYELGGKPVAWEVVREWLTGKPGDASCTWRRDGDRGFYVASARGITSVEMGPLLGFAILADARGPQLLVGTNIGEYGVYDLAPTPTQRKHLQYMWPNEEDYAGQDQLGPYCGP